MLLQKLRWTWQQLFPFLFNSFKSHPFLHRQYPLLFPLVQVTSLLSKTGILFGPWADLATPWSSEGSDGGWNDVVPSASVCVLCVCGVDMLVSDGDRVSVLAAVLLSWCLDLWTYRLVTLVVAMTTRTKKHFMSWTNGYLVRFIEFSPVNSYFLRHSKICIVVPIQVDKNAR